MSSRIVTKRDGSRWSEVDIPGRPGVVRQTRISGGSSVVRGGGPCGLADATGARPRTSADPLPRLFEELPPSYEVTLGMGVRSRILAEIEEITRQARAHGLEEAETGGWLLCDAELSPDHISMATGPGDGAYVTRTSTELKMEVFEETQRRHPHLRVRGDFHFHPNGDPVPSRTDRRAWQCGSKLIDSYWVGVIATPGQGLFAEPTLHGWITMPGAGSTVGFCEPLKLRTL